MNPSTLEPFIEDFYEDNLEEFHLPGAVFLAVKDGEILYSNTAGFADISQERPIVIDETIFRIGSITKLFTATAIMQLAEQGKINLNEDINTYFSSFQIEEAFGEPITVSHLLTHTAGFDDQILDIGVQDYRQALPIEEYLKQGMPKRIRPPGEMVQYSNHGIALLGYLIEEVSGQSYEDFIEANIFSPLRMDHSKARLQRETIPNLAREYVFKNNEVKALPLYEYNISPAGSITSTPADMANFMVAHLQKGRFNNERILAEATAQQMHSQQFTHHPDLAGFAYGFYERRTGGVRFIEHRGNTNGSNSNLMLLPEQNLGFFFANNGTEGEQFNYLLTEALIKRFFPYEEESAETIESQSDRFAGSYKPLRHSRNSLGKLLVLFSPQVSVEANADQTITVTRYGEGKTYVPVEPLLFRNDQGETVGFRERDDGTISHFYEGWWAAEKNRWFETPAVILAGAASALVLFLLTLIGFTVKWIISWIRKRKRVIGKTRYQQGCRRFAIASSLIGIIFAGIFLITFSAADSIALVLWEMPLQLKIALWLPLLLLLTTLGLFVYWILGLRQGGAGKFHLFFYPVFLIFSIVFLIILNDYKLLGFYY